MTYQIKAFSFTIPARTAKASPAVMPTPLGQYVVSGLEIVVPPGPNGMVGIRFTSGGTQMIPANDGAWIIASGEVIPWSLTGQITSGAWEVRGYNLGLNDHTIQLRYLLDLVPAAAAPASPPLLSVADIVGPLDGITAGSGVDAQ